MRFKLKWGHIPYIVAYALAFAMIGALDVITGKVSLWELNIADFVKNFVLLSAANWLAFLATAQMFTNKIVDYNEKTARAENEEVEERKEKGDKRKVHKSVWTLLVNTLVFLLDRIDEDLSQWSVDKSMERKEKRWVIKINKQLLRLENKSKFKDHEIEANGTAAQKRKNRYCRKKKTYLEKLSEPYIKKNLRYLNVKFHPVSENFIRLGVDDDRYDDPNIPETSFKKKARDLYPKLVLNLSFAKGLNRHCSKRFVVL